MRLAAGEQFARAMTPSLFSWFMSGEVRKGERIPRMTRRNLKRQVVSLKPSHEMVSLATLDDKNQYGPVAMMVLLLIVAAITGTVIRLLG